jgi:excisionase family DNA binding protein
MLSCHEAYRLGSLPGRVFRLRCRPDWLEKTAETLLETVDQWASILRQIKCRELLDAATELKTRIEAELAYEADLQKYELLQKQRAVAERLSGEKLDPPTEPAPLPDGRTSRELLRDLLIKAREADLAEHLPIEAREFYELGRLMADCQGGSVDEQSALRIWTIARDAGCEEWITGCPAGTRLPEGLTIARLITDRTDKIDRLFWEGPLPVRAVQGDHQQDADETQHASPYLTIREAADLLKVGEDTVERLISSGQLPASEISGKGRAAGRKVKRITREALDEFMHRAQTAPKAEKRAWRPSSLKPPKDYFR